MKLPICELVESCDTINSAKIIFARYNEEAGALNSAHGTLLMLRKADMYKFFLKNQLSDGKTSYLTSFTSGTNEYVFSNIANLFKHCYHEYISSGLSLAEWEAKNPDWDKVVLIPVSTTADSNGSVVKIVHDISIASMRLRGGTEYEIPIEVVTSKFKE